jgi:glyoxylase-like metal-dependent hydrolase (beta-lactamase superfamily II)/rhodanese-related sulfurtransferase
MIFRQFIDDDLFCASYLLGDGGEAVVVDPGWDVDRYLDAARALRVEIRLVLETHVHADHVSGRTRLAELTGATAYVPAGGEAEAPQATLREGNVLRVGQLELRAVATPGHRPEHLSYLVVDTACSEEPCLLLAGDSLLVGDVARPDLAVTANGEVEQAAGALFDTVHRLAGLADHVELWPGHLGGSLCGGGGLTHRISSTIGYERRTSLGLRAGDERTFAASLLERLPERPPTVERVVALNRSAAALVAGPLAQLSPHRVRELLAADALLVDGRTADDFDAGSLPGSLSIPLDIAGVGNRAAWFAADRRIVVNAANAEEACVLAKRLAAVGLVDVAGMLAGGIDAWRRAGFPVVRMNRVGVGELAQLLRDDAVTLVDLRDDDEYALGHVPGSLHIPWREVSGRSPDAVASGKPVVVACASGRRTPVAASALARPGGPRVLRLAEGGIGDLAEHGVSLVRE